MSTIKDNRKHPRYEYQTGTLLEFNDGSTQECEVLNISIGGVLITTDPPPVFGERIQLHIDLPGEPERWIVPCTVRWIKSDNRVGLQFERRRQMKLWALKRLKSGLK